MQGQSSSGGTSAKEIPGSEKGYEKTNDNQTEDKSSTNPGASEQNPGTSRTTEDVTGTGEERGQTAGTDTETIDPAGKAEGQQNDDPTIRNPSGDDLSQGIRGDEGSGRGI